MGKFRTAESIASFMRKMRVGGRYYRRMCDIDEAFTVEAVEIVHFRGFPYATVQARDDDGSEFWFIAAGASAVEALCAAVRFMADYSLPVRCRLMKKQITNGSRYLVVDNVADGIPDLADGIS